MSDGAVNAPRHPNRFHADRRQAQEFKRWRDTPRNPPAADSPVVCAQLSPIEQELRRHAQAEVDAAIAARPKPKPWELRERYPSGWLNAPYVACPRLTELCKKKL